MSSFPQTVDLSSTLELQAEQPALELVGISPAVIACLQPLLLKYALRMTGQRAAAEDIVQETWISAMQGVHAYEGRSALSTWLFAIMRRRAADLRRKSRRSALPLRAEHWVADTRLAEELDARMCAHRLEASLDVLPELEREAIGLCDVRGFEREEAAELMNVTRGHLRVLLHRGRARLRATIESCSIDTHATGDDSPCAERTSSR